KHHLAGTSKNVAVCKAVTDEVKQEMFQIVNGLHERLLKKIANEEYDWVEVTEDDYQFED
ncbi:hypothetical protein A2U01_0099277, partial [Trifolium medium]|nr:hypothetical protein [Trifolium medium]